jgi:hypothetical protein
MFTEPIAFRLGPWGVTETSAQPHRRDEASAAIAGENGATETQLMAILGWKTMKEAERYARAARQKVLAGSALRLLVPDRKRN